MFGCSICLDAPHVWMAPCIFGCPHMPPCMFGHPLFGCPLCLDAVWMSLYIHNTRKACFVRLRGVHMPPYIWMPPVHKHHKESMLCQTKGCPYAPIHLDAPCMFRFCHMFGCTPVCLNVPICLDVPMQWPVFVYCVVGALQK